MNLKDKNPNTNLAFYLESNRKSGANLGKFIAFLLILIILICLKFVVHPAPINDYLLQKPEKKDDYYLNFGGNVAVIGHLNPDMDTVAASVAGAYLFQGIAVLSGQANTESKFCLEKFNVPLPIQVDELDQKENFKWMLVDHGAQTLRSNLFKEENILAILDHHKLAEDEVEVPVPIYVDIRPWGSSNSILFYHFRNAQKVIPYRIAGVMACAIISDTLNLRSPTKTKFDEIALSALLTQIGYENSTKLAYELFEAKSDISGLTQKEVILLDFKIFKSNGRTFGWGSGNTVRPELYFASGVLENYIEALEQVKTENALDYIFFSVTDIDPQQSDITTTLITLKDDLELATRAFPQGKVLGRNTIFIGALVSRKTDFIPAIERALGAN